MIGHDIWTRRPTGLVLGLDFSGERVSSPTGKDGTLLNGASVSGRKLVLDGVDDALVFSASPDLSFTDGAGQDIPFSISTWVYLTNLNNVGQMAVCKLKDSAPAAYEYFLRATNNSGASGRVQFAVFNSSASANLSVLSSSGIPAATWVNLTAVYSGGESSGNMNLYIQGVLDSAATKSSSGSYTGMSETSAQLSLGRRTTIEPLRGSIGTTMIFRDRELSASEVTQIYNTGAARIAAGGTP